MVLLRTVSKDGFEVSKVHTTLSFFFLLPPTWKYDINSQLLF